MKTSDAFGYADVAMGIEGKEDEKGVLGDNEGDQGDGCWKDGTIEDNEDKFEEKGRKGKG